MERSKEGKKIKLSFESAFTWERVRNELRITKQDEFTTELRITEQAAFATERELNAAGL
jgi:hypothetical protein